MLNFDTDSPDDLEPIAPFPDDKVPLDSPIPDETEDLNETEIAEDDEVDDESDTTLTQ